VKKTLGFLLLIALAPTTGFSAEELTLAETIEAQEALIQRRPNLAKLHNDLGNLLLLVGNPSEAEASYRRAVSINPDLASAHFNLGLLLQQTQRSSKAEREFKQTTSLQPDHAWAHYQLGVLKAERGRRDSAIKSYARALRLDPRLTDPAYNPHILDNHLAPSATLAAYADDSSADLVPRTYESPRRIAGLLVPMLPGAIGDPEGIPVEQATPTAEAADGLEHEQTVEAGTGGAAGAEVKPAPQEPVKKKKPRRKKRKKKG
jgi:tetratricopeptide (TPR) repeat protein